MGVPVQKLKVHVFVFNFIFFFSKRCINWWSSINSYNIKHNMHIYFFVNLLRAFKKKNYFCIKVVFFLELWEYKQDRNNFHIKFYIIKMFFFAGLPWYLIPLKNKEKNQSRKLKTTYFLNLFPSSTIYIKLCEFLIFFKKI